VLDLFQPPKVNPCPTRVVLLADVEPRPALTLKTATPGKARVPAERAPRKARQVERKDAKYWRLTDAERAERNQQSREWYYANRERVLAQAKVRYEAMTPEQKEAKLAYGRALKAKKRAEQKARTP
jgi:hypothetical protein